jgi:hypothetical protein
MLFLLPQPLNAEARPLVAGRGESASRIVSLRDEAKPRAAR